MRLKNWGALIALIAFYFSTTSSAFGQAAALGTISGRVTDSSGASVAGATVTATNPETNAHYSGATTSDGFYTVSFVQPGTYVLEIAQAGFDKAVQRNVIVGVAGNPTVNVTLTVGAVSQTVTVTQQVSMVDFETADRGGVIDTERAQYTPTTGRVITSIFPSVPGVVLSANDRGMVPSGNSGATAFMVNGGQDRTNQMLYDGVPNRVSVGGFTFGVIPTQETVAETNVITNPYSSQYGSTTGGVINVITKSGTNEYHGELFTYIRNDAFNANTFERNLAGLPRTRLEYNTFGGVVTGKLWKDKLFGVFQYHTNRTASVKSYLGRVPTALEREGDFSQTYYSKGGVPTPVTIYDPFSTVYDAATGTYSRTPVPGNRIPASQLNPVAKALFQYIPLPNVPTNSLIKSSNYIPSGSLSAPTEYHEFMPRVDWNISERMKMMVRYTRTILNQYDIEFYPTAANVNSGFPYIRANHNAVFDLTRTLSPSSVLDFRVGFEQYSVLSNEVDRLKTNPATLGFSQQFVSEAAAAIPLFNFGGSTLGSTNFTGAGVAASSANPDQLNTFDLNWSKIMGRQNLKVGGEFLLERINNLSPGSNAGNFTFNSVATGSNPQAQVAGTGDEVASFLYGVGASGYLDRNATTTRQQKTFSAFVQDDIKITPKWTLNLGLRFDKTGGLTDRYNAMTGPFITTVSNPLGAQVKAANGAANCPACANLLGGLAFPGVNGVSRSPYGTNNTDFGPRIATAYALNSKTALRAGYGFFFGPIYYDPGSSGFSQQTPWVIYDSRFNPINTLTNPFPSGLLQPVGAGNASLTNVGATVTFVDPDAQAPRSRQFSFEIQRELPSSILLTLGYVNNTITRLPINKNLNALTPAQAALGRSVLNASVANPFAGLAPGTSLNQSTIALSSLIVPYPQFSSVNEIDSPHGSSRYDALQAYLVKRFSNGISASTSFTWAKKIEKTVYQYDTDPYPEKMISPLDIPFTFTQNMVAELPFGHGRKFFHEMPRWADTIFGGWQINGLIRLQSGEPVQMGANAIPTGADPNAVPGGQSLNQWINPAAFVANTDPYPVRRWSTRFTNLRSPWIHRVDLGVTKKIAITERFKFELTAIAPNAFNSPEWWAFPSGNTANPANASFGRIAGVSSMANSPRQLQLGARLTF